MKPLIPVTLAISLVLPAQTPPAQPARTQPARPEAFFALAAQTPSLQPQPAQPDRLETARRLVLREKRVGVSEAESVLSLVDAIQLALKNNLDIEIERTNIASSVQGIKGARGAFDPLLLWAPGIESRNVPAASSLVSASGKLSEHYHNEYFYFRQRTPTSGFAYHIDFENQRQSTNNPFVSLNPNWAARLTAGFSMPLWRYRETDNERTQLKIRLTQEQQSHADFETRVVDVITRTQNAYWDLTAAIEDAVVAYDGVELARDQHERNKRQVAAGTLASIELSASEAEVQRRMDTYVSAVGVVTVAENILKTILTPDNRDPLWNQRITPTDRRPMSFPIEEVGEATSLALKQRPELRSLDLRYEQTEQLRKLAVSSTKPQVNLAANYINSGLAGTTTSSSGGFAAAFGPLFGRVNDLSAFHGLPPLPPVNIGGGAPPALVGGYGQALSNLFSGNFQTFVGGLQIEWNPRNRSAEATLEQAVIAQHRLKLTRTQLEQGITAEVRSALQALETARQRIAAAEASQRASSEKLDSEVRLFQTGESTNFLVLTRQNELLDSRRRVIGGYLLLNRAVARLQQATGSTLEMNKITLN